MINFLDIRNKKLAFTDQGKGSVIVLVHGYLESLKIWNEFASDLAKNYRVICFDIPGHGQSETQCEKHTMLELALTISEALNLLEVQKCFMIGHSMGGYLTLMFHETFPEKLTGFSLFHSHPYADAKETIKKRTREIELVKEGKKDLIAKYNIPNAFADSNLSKLTKEVEEATQIALNTSEDGIIANLFAMMNRPDLSQSLSQTAVPFLYIAGKNDNYIDFERVASKIQLPKISEFHVLEESGHMGFIEEKEKSLNSIIQFLNTL